MFEITERSWKVSSERSCGDTCSWKGNLKNEKLESFKFGSLKFLTEVTWKVATKMRKSDSAIDDMMLMT